MDTDVVVPIPRLLERHSNERPDKVAFCDERSAVTYRELAERTARLAGHLADAGLTDQQRLLMFLDNCVEVVEGYLAAPRAGCVTVCANPNSTAAEFAHILADSEATVILTDAARLDTVLKLIGSASGCLVSLVIVVDPPAGGVPTASVAIVAYADLVGCEPARRPADATDLDTWCWMLYTSGTTGRPKGVRLTQRSFLWVIAACWVSIAGIDSDDVVLATLPFFHSYALSVCILTVAAVGASARISRKFSPSRVLNALRAEGVTVLPGVPTMFRYLIEAADGTELKAPALRFCFSAGAVLTVGLNDEFERFAGVPLLDGYGTTETSTMVTMNSPVGGRVPGSCGLPISGLSIRLIDPRSGVDVLPGGEGELWVHSPGVMQGYHRRPEATAEALVAGWYRTGDIARRDESGFLRITGRIKELIIRGGENIYPAEIEEVLLSSGSVADAAVIAKPDEYLGEVPVAFVVASPGATIDEDELAATCRNTLSAFKIPVAFIVVDAIPRTSSGKIQRHRLVLPTRERA